MIQYHDLIMDVLEFQQIIHSWFFRHRYSDSNEVDKELHGVCEKSNRGGVMNYQCDICATSQPCTCMSPMTCVDGVFFICSDCVNKVLSTFPDFRSRTFKDLKRVSGV